MLHTAEQLQHLPQIISEAGSQFQGEVITDQTTGILQIGICNTQFLDFNMLSPKQGHLNIMHRH